MKRPILLFCVFLLAAGCGPGRKDPVDYVNPYAGNISHLLVPTFPTVQLPTGAGGNEGFFRFKGPRLRFGKNPYFCVSVS